jgi:hypothetical protein
MGAIARRWDALIGDFLSSSNTQSISLIFTDASHRLISCLFAWKAQHEVYRYGLPRKDGSVAWLAQIVIKRGGTIVLPENKRFDLRPMPEAGAVNPARLKPRSNAG